ncbi:ABC transporter substrate-binding protein [Chengkuizengella axinellae]|uniref:ABC transporter substrate-binding protein n=1 Tax=Chengkuizengella axinellae TaxID=3064388 RepID=A0ABT9IXT0_9BACL|nr:ABC transporter substrate-binding protein [Chengkuizengella sp. 2205SS18-9]MDP5274048.1 ABC transporter substrate-binding protein [Chengkuizengella sp. 2205SS18-9]
MKKMILVLFSVLLMLSIVAAGCGSGSNTVSVYTAFPEQEVIVYLEAFKEETGIEVKHVRLSAGETLARIKAESSNPQASVWFGGPSDTFVAAANDGLLEAYQPEGVSNIPEQFRDVKKVWTPIYVGALGFASNSEWLEKEGLEPPQSWADLLKPEYAGNVTMAHPASSGTAYSIFATLVQLKGEQEALDYFLQLDENIRQYTKSGSAPAKQAGFGETGVGISFAHDILKPKHEGYPITLSFPTDGTGYEVGAVALIKGGPSDQAENAKKFIDWAISKQAQDLYADSGSFRLPVNPEAKVPEGAVKLSDLSVIDYDAVWAGENRDDLLDKFESYVVGKESVVE